LPWSVTRQEKLEPLFREDKIKMQLSYRGIPYQKTTVNPVLEIVETGILPEEGLPRISATQYPRHLGSSLAKIERKYRGVKYSGNNYSPQEQLDLCPTLNFYQSPARQGQDTAQQHLNSIRANLEKRIRAAQNAGNEALVKLLQQEYQDLSLN